MIRALIAQGETKEASEQISEFLKSLRKIENDSTQLLNRVNNLKNEELSNTISQEHKSVQFDQLTMATLFTCQEIEKTILAYFPTLNFKNASVSLEEELAAKLLGKYKDIGKVIDGQSAIFFRARQINTDRKVMLRVAKNQRYGEVALAEQEKEKLEKVFGIKHRNIIKIINADLEKSPSFIVLEHISGVPLNHLINRTPFTLRRSLSIFRQISHAIYYLHINEIAHKNIKPDKVLIDHELIPVISPFDIVSRSGAANDASFTMDQLLYTSPELLKNARAEEAYAADQFSLALLMYELVAGMPLFAAKKIDASELNVHEVIENRLNFFKIKKRRKELINKLDLPKRIKNVLLKMLAENPTDRFANMREVILEIDKEIRLFEEDDTVEIASASYERCCIANPDFVENFYDKLFAESDYKEEMLDFFPTAKIKSSSLDKDATAQEKAEQKEAEQKESKRFKMLKIAIDLLVNCKKEYQKLQYVLHLNIHQGVQKHLFKSFAQTIISCIEENDPLWKKDGKEDKIGKAWTEILQSFNVMLDQ